MDPFLISISDLNDQTACICDGFPYFLDVTLVSEHNKRKHVIVLANWEDANFLLI